MVSWSDTQITAQVAPNSKSGTARVLQSGIWSNAVSFQVNGTGPTITQVSPASAYPNDTVTITGQQFGSTQATGTLQLGSTNGLILTWTDTQITARVAAGSLSGIARVQQGGALSNAVGFTVLGGAGSAVTMAPNLLNMVVGDTRTLQALDASSHPVSGLTWNSSDNTVVSLSNDDPPTLTALAAGHVTITAGAASADITVWPAGTVLAPGTTLWSNPGNASGVYKIVPAVPSPTGVADVFAIQNDGSIQAITADGITAWTATTGVSAENLFVSPDFQGGVIVGDFHSGHSEMYRKLDGITGQPYPAFGCPANSGCSLPRIHPDGTIFITTYEDPDNADTAFLTGFDSTTGSTKFKLPSPSNSCPRGTLGCWAGIGDPIIAGDGYTYTGLSFSDSSGLSLKYLRTDTSGASTEILVKHWNVPFFSVWNGVGSSLEITNADQGIAFTWYAKWATDDPNNPAFFGADTGMATVSGNGVNLSNAPSFPGFDTYTLSPYLQTQDGLIVYTSWAGGAGLMFATDTSGNIRWSIPGWWQPQIATADGGIIATQYDGPWNTYDEWGFPKWLDPRRPIGTATFDKNGTATGQMPTLPTYSWKGAYQVGSVESLIPSFDIALIALSYAAVPQGNLAGNGFSLKHHSFGLVFCGTAYGDDGPCSSTPDVSFSYKADISDSNYSAAVNFGDDHRDWVDLVKNYALDAFQKAFAKLPVIVAGKDTASKLHHDQNPDNLTAFEHTVYIDGHWMLRSEPPRSGLIGLAQAYPPNGYTTPDNRNDGDAKKRWSRVYYLAVMGNAQAGVGCAAADSCNPLRPSYPPQTPVDQNAFRQLVPAIGRGIGRVAAHETAHQIVPFALMDCVTTCESKDVLEGADSTGANSPWFYVDNAQYQDAQGHALNARIDWGSQVRQVLKNYLLNQKQ